MPDEEDLPPSQRAGHRHLRDRPQDYFIRGRIVIPVIDCKEPFIWGPWASVSKQGFVRFGQLLGHRAARTSRRCTAGSATTSRSIRPTTGLPVPDYDEERAAAPVFRA